MWTVPSTWGCGVEYDYTASGILAALASLAGWLAFRVGRFVTRQRWTHIVVAEDTERIATERDALRIRVHELELRTSAAEAKATSCREHASRAIEERDRLARRIAGLEVEANEISDDQ